MSGHSKWTQIKRQKAITDKKRSGVFTKLANAISIAAREGGKDSEMNFRLRMAIEKARAANMPNENVERAIKRGTGELGGAAIEEVVYEGFGPGGVAIIVEATTDNKNRTASTIRNIFEKHNGRFGNSGSVGYLFQKKGVIRVAKNAVADKEDFELKLIDANAEDIAEEEEGYTVYTAPENFSAVRTYIEGLKITPESSDFELVPQTKVTVPDEHTKEQLIKMLEELEADDDVNNYFTNADI